MISSFAPADGVHIRIHHLGGDGPPLLCVHATGFHGRIWEAEIADDALVFSLVSPNREEGYPGKLEVSATYRLDDDVLSCDIEATTTSSTIINLTNHAYWNLSGADKVTDHVLQISAQAYTPTDRALIPVGLVSFVSGTDFDFREPVLLDEAFVDDEGFDSNFCLEGERHVLHHAAGIAAGGRELELWTTEPGLQFYTAAHHGPALKGKKGQALRRFGDRFASSSRASNTERHDHVLKCDQLTTMFASRMTRLHLSRSRFACSAKASGVPPTASAP